MVGEDAVFVVNHTLNLLIWLNLFKLHILINLNYIFTTFVCAIFILHSALYLLYFKSVCFHSGYVYSQHMSKISGKEHNPFSLKTSPGRNYNLKGMISCLYTVTMF